MGANTTLTADVFVPEVFGGIVASKVPGKIVVSGLAKTDTRLTGQPGALVPFQKRRSIADMDEVQEAALIPVSKLGHDPSKYEVIKVARGVEFSDEAAEDTVDNMLDYAATEIAGSYARKRDALAIQAAIAGTVLSKTLADADAVTYGDIVGALALLGDEADITNVAGLVLRSEAYFALMVDERFVAATQAVGDGGVVLNGTVSRFAGLPVYVSDRLPETLAGLIIMRDAITIFEKRAFTTELVRDGDHQVTRILGSARLGAARTDDKGVIALANP